MNISDIDQKPNRKWKYFHGFFSYRGWKDGDGLGKEGDGRVEPVKAEERPERQGLGTNVFNTKLTFGISSQRKESIKKTQERFSNLKWKKGKKNSSNSARQLVKNVKLQMVNEWNYLQK